MPTLDQAIAALVDLLIAPDDAAPKLAAARLDPDVLVLLLGLTSELLAAMVLQTARTRGVTYEDSLAQLVAVVRDVTRPGDPLPS